MWYSSDSHAGCNRFFFPQLPAANRSLTLVLSTLMASATAMTCCFHVNQISRVVGEHTIILCVAIMTGFTVVREQDCLPSKAIKWQCVFMISLYHASMCCRNTTILKSFKKSLQKIRGVICLWCHYFSTHYARITDVSSLGKRVFSSCRCQVCSEGDKYFCWCNKQPYLAVKYYLICVSGDTNN